MICSSARQLCYWGWARQTPKNPLYLWIFRHTACFQRKTHPRWVTCWPNTFRKVHHTAASKSLNTSVTATVLENVLNWMYRNGTYNVRSVYWSCTPICTEVVVPKWSAPCTEMVMYRTGPTPLAQVSGIQVSWANVSPACRSSDYGDFVIGKLTFCQLRGQITSEIRTLIGEPKITRF